jgi:translation initiation factor 3 subunit A
MFTQKKRAFQKVFESIMKRHLELCVDLKDFRTAKDGLHQYRTMTQLVDPQSLEAVSMHLIELAETRASEARMKADKVALAAAAKISDLDQEETPETIMLLSMTYEGAKDRTNREVVVPWLKFLWETYRTILELLYKNNRLERVYHKTCEKAFKFCQDYQRHNEFRRLCEMLRSHFANLQRATQMNLRANKPAWEWTSEGVELHLQTRFSQLEVSSSLELWNEGFRTVEDIYDIMQLNKKTPKPKLMVTYYEKLTRIFWVSENYLFHAYAWFRFYCLCLECKKDMKPEERSLQASCVLLAAMCIPNFRETEGPAAVLEDDEVAAEKNAQMALLLDFQANPTRQALLGEIVSRGVLNEVPPELSALYHSLETGFRPLNLVKDMAPMLAYVKGDAGLCMYSIPLQKVATLRTVMHLSRVFSTLRLSSLKDLVANLDLSYCDIEKLLVDSASNRFS